MQRIPYPKIRRLLNEPHLLNQERRILSTILRVQRQWPQISKKMYDAYCLIDAKYPYKEEIDDSRVYTATEKIV